MITNKQILHLIVRPVRALCLKLNFHLVYFQAIVFEPLAYGPNNPHTGSRSNLKKLSEWEVQEGPVAPEQPLNILVYVGIIKVGLFNPTGIICYMMLPNPYCTVGAEDEPFSSTGLVIPLQSCVGPGDVSVGTPDCSREQSGIQYVVKQTWCH